ncbi:MAG: TerC family protein [Planctomycetota bacterium]
MLAFAADDAADAAAPWFQVLKIVLLDLLLAGDNAVVIALAVRLLPAREQRLGRLWGTAGAVALRIVFLALATWLLAIPWLQFGGGLLLVWIAWKLLSPAEHGPVADMPDAPGEPPVRVADSLRAAIRIIIVADASMSLDNVIAITGASDGHLGLAAGGIALSIPLVIWGSQVVGSVMARLPWVVWLGGGILGHVAGVLMLEEKALVPWFGVHPDPGWHPLPWTLAAVFFLYGMWASRRRT